jgi:hypothetical protein
MNTTATSTTPSALLQGQIDRLTQMGDLADQAMQSLPNSTDNDTATELLTGLGGLIRAGCEELQRVGPSAVTDLQEFSRPGASEQGIFCVRAGVPLNDAFDQLSMLQDAAIQALEALAMNESDDNQASPLWSIFHTLNMANTLTQSMHHGHMAGLPVIAKRG